MEKITQIKRQAVKHLDRYFTGTESATDLRAWALAHPIFANPKELDNSEDWMVSNALALMVAVAEADVDRSEVEKRLQEARRFLTGEAPFPDDRWPAGLLFQQR